MFLKPQFDESIHGFFIRAFLVLGLARQASDLEGVVSSNGVVRALPRLTSHGAYIMDSLLVDDVFKLVIDHTKMNITGAIFQDELTGYVFLGDELPHFMEIYKINKRTRLRYCPRCFSEQIRKCGFPWFRLSWLSSVMCDIHERYLLEVYQSQARCCGSESNILDYIRSAMSGICVKCKSDCWFLGQKVYFNRYFDSYHLL